MKFAKTLFVLSSILLLSNTLTACGGANAESSLIVGKWNCALEQEASKNTSHPLRFSTEYRKDGRFGRDGDFKDEYRVKGDELFIGLGGSPAIIDRLTESTLHWHHSNITVECYKA